MSTDDSFLRARAGERKAFAELVRKHQKSVYSLALRMMANPHKAEDLAQDVFLQLHCKLESIESDAHLAFWLRKVTTNRAIDLLRQEPRGEVVPLEDEGDLVSEPNAEDPLLHRQLQDWLSELGPAPRAVMLLRYQEDLDPVDIAKSMDMSIHTVKSHLKRSLATLRARMLGLSVADTDRSYD